MNWSQNDEFVTFYRNKGDFHKNPPDIPALHKAVDYHNCRIYYHPQIVVDAVCGILPEIGHGLFRGFISSGILATD